MENVLMPGDDGLKLKRPDRPSTRIDGRMPTMVNLMGESPGIAAVREQIKRLLVRHPDAKRLPPVLIQGETGTGKGLLAREIHRMSPRGSHALVDVNCPAIPETLLEAELFGYERGAFTDARQPKAGLFQVAHGSTIFLDEVGLLPEALQRKLLTVIEEHVVRRLGSTRSEHVDVWVVAASNEDLEAAIRARRFREDLYHRLAALTIWLPPLRERGSDILLLAEHFLTRACAEHGLPPKVLTADARAALATYRWPGNVRELANRMERVALLVDEHMVTAAMLDLPKARVATTHAAASLDDTVVLDDMMRDHVLDVLNRTQWNISRSASLLGIARNTLRSRIEKYGLRQDRLVHRAQRSEPAATHAASAPLPAETRAPAEMRWERRHLTLLRGRVLTPSEALGPVDTSRILEILAAKIQTFGGRLQALSPTGIAAVFGVQPADGAPQHAALAAMAIRTATERARQSAAAAPAIKIGIHVGQFLLASTPSGIKLDMEAERDAWAMLEALLEHAQPNITLVTDAAAPFLERQFELAPAGSEDRSSDGYKLLGRERSGFGLAGRATKFVGRQHELELLHSRFASVSRGRGQFVGIAGEPGMGKSRLLFEFIQALTGTPVTYIEACCHSYGTRVPFLPVLQMLQGFCRWTDTDTPVTIKQKLRRSLEDLGMEAEDATPYLLQIVGIKDGAEGLADVSSSVVQARTFEILRVIALESSRRRPLVLAVEDVHWIDPTSEAYMASLAESLAGAPILLVATYRSGYRPTWLDKSYATQVALQPLAPGDSLTIVEAVLGPDRPIDDVAEGILSRADGIPLFLEELARTIRDHPERSSDPRIPDTLEDVLLARIDRLPDDPKCLLQAASVLGRDIPLRVLKALWDRPDSMESHLRELVRLEFLYPRGASEESAYGFRNALIQETTYAGIPDHRRRVLHEAAGRALETIYAGRIRQVADLLAYHYAKTEQSAKAVEYLMSFAEHAARLHCHAEASEALHQALRHAEQLPAGPPRDRVFVDLVLCHAHSSDFLGRVQETLAQLLEHRDRLQDVGDGRLIGPYQFWLGRIYTILGDHEQAVLSAQQALDHGRRHSDHGAIGKALYLLAYEEYWSGRPSQGVEYGRESVAHLERTNDAWWTGVAHWVVAINHGAIGEFASAIAAAARYNQIAETLRDPRLLSCAATALGTFRALRGEPELGIEVCRRGVDLAPNASIAVVALGALGGAYVEMGNTGEAIQCLEQVMSRLGDGGGSRNGGWFSALLSEAHLLNGDVKKAHELALRALHVTRDTGNWYGIGYAERILGRIALASGALAEAEGFLGDALRTFDSRDARFEVGRTHMGLAMLGHARGDTDAVAGHIRQAVALFEALGVVKYVARAEHVGLECGLAGYRRVASAT